MGWLRDLFLEPAEKVERVAPLEGTNMSLWNSIIPDWWANNITRASLYGTADLADRVWVANRCQQMNAQQIAGMPLKWVGGQGTDQPAWVSAPDPHMFPNGIGDALHALVSYMYGWGFTVLYVLDTYSTGFPRRWTVLPSERLSITFVDGSRQYKLDDEILPAHRCIQIDRNPGTAAHGTSALRAYAPQLYGLLAASQQSLSVSQGGIPQALLIADAVLTPELAQGIKTKWMSDPTPGAPKVIGKDLKFEALTFNPSDMSLLETQEFNAKVIATAYGIPPTLVNMALVGGLTYQNPASLMEQWWRSELRSTTARIGNAFTAQMLPAGQSVWFDAADMWAPLTPESPADDEQLSQVAAASPAQQPRALTAIGGG